MEMSEIQIKLRDMDINNSKKSYLFINTNQNVTSEYRNKQGRMHGS